MMMEQGKRKLQNLAKKHDRFERYMLLLLTVSLIPLLVIGRYNVMAADDYAMGKVVHQIWVTTDDMCSVLYYAFIHIIEAYRTWQGCFTVDFLDSLNPGMLSERLTWITPCVMLIIILLGTYCLVKEILIKYYTDDKRDRVILWALIVFLLLQTLPGPVEALYWYSGAVAYTFLHFSTLLLFAFAFHIERLKSNGRITVSGILLILFAFIIGGGQYGTVLECMLWYAVYIFIERKRLTWYKVISFLSLGCGFVISMLAPGNATRHSQSVGMPPASAILLSFSESFRYLRHWISPLLIACLLVAAPVIWKIIKREKNITYQLPGLVSIGSFCLFAAAFTPSLYGVGNVDSGRIQNQIQSVFYIVIWINAFYWTGWIQRKMENSQKDFWKDCCAIKDILKKYLWAYRWLAFALILLVFVGTSDKNTFSSMSALRSLVNGEARSYYEQAQERLALYQDDTISVVEVEPFTVRPKVLYFTDVVEEGNVNYWINENIADYYGKEKVLLMK